MERWRGKHALVTGASAGIGYAIVEGLLQAGVHVVACARNPATLHALKETLKADSDILVNNAGIGYFGEVGSGSIAEWREMLNLNILSTTICTKETLRLLEKDGITTGHVININSIAGHRSIEGFNFYSGTKHMLTALTKALHVELANKKSKIRVTSLSPGLVSLEPPRT
ncbi:putative Dehydrogenase/reductase SDR family member 11 [Hypsibius exemplaris]|uniref:Dehydrogenase/reductase SDR family member 11 n=1 Tax=Hypsibius exemplaris TaxID=2072580 RepID=A0A1W0WUD4_HYPEX|nr:putative Dehydrogenase/reductase SDR family member 11 [Hypsibius exemplaris]